MQNKNWRSIFIQAKKIISSLIITNYELRITNYVVCHPRVLWVGIGCNKGTSKELIQAAIGQVFREHQLEEGAIAGIASIDIKANEAGLVELCRERNLPLKTFSADVLRTVCVPNPTKVVSDAVLTPSVAEAAALCAASDLTPFLGESQEKLFIWSRLGVRLLVSKQIFRSSNQSLKYTIQNQKGTVTIAVAEAAQEYREIINT